MEITRKLYEMIKDDFGFDLVEEFKANPDRSTDQELVTADRALSCLIENLDDPDFSEEITYVVQRLNSFKSQIHSAIGTPEILNIVFPTIKVKEDSDE